MQSHGLSLQMALTKRFKITKEKSFIITTDKIILTPEKVSAVPLIDRFGIGETVMLRPFFPEDE